MHIAVLGLGTNIGSRLANLQCALRQLGKAGLKVQQVSSLYETAPWGVTDQPAFLNAAVSVVTDLTPPRLLEACQRVEAACGRRPGLRWGPRVIDVDILLYADWNWYEPDLQIPHPRLHERRFMLVPLQDLGIETLPVSKHFPQGQAVARLLAAVAHQELQKVMGPSWP